MVQEPSFPGVCDFPNLIDKTKYSTNESEYVVAILYSDILLLIKSTPIIGTGLFVCVIVFLSACLFVYLYICIAHNCLKSQLEILYPGIFGDILDF